MFKVKVGTLVVEERHRIIGIVVGRPDKEGKVLQVRFYKTDTEQIIDSRYLLPLMELPEKDRKLSLEKILEKHSEAMVINLALRLSGIRKILIKSTADVAVGLKGVSKKQAAQFEELSKKYQRL